MDTNVSLVEVCRRTITTHVYESTELDSLNAVREQVAADGFVCTTPNKRIEGGDTIHWFKAAKID